MEIQIFKDVTTEDVLIELEAEAEKYDGLYVDMDDLKQRTYVKNGASKINELLKVLDRKRIDESKQYKAKVEAEAKSIRERLEAANKPYTLLIDAHKEKRAKILAEEKAEAKAKEDFKQLQIDHEMAILMNNEYDRNYESMIAERERAEKERLAEIERQKDAAAEQAVTNERMRQERIAEQERQAELQRENDRAHVGDVRRKAKEAIMALGIEEEKAKEIILAIHNNQIPNVNINY